MSGRILPAVAAAALAMVCAACFYALAGKNRGPVARLALAAVGAGVFLILRWQMPAWLASAADALSVKDSQLTRAASPAAIPAAAVAATVAAGVLWRMIAGPGTSRRRAEVERQHHRLFDVVDAALPELEPLRATGAGNGPGRSSTARDAYATAPDGCPHCGQPLPGNPTHAGR